ncbi:MAG: hypothetical protein JWN63_433 [Candidatus Acidoferrum typicum]|nr:hypothetical protein [Candidatus Acidoferrum typicum]
MPRSRSEQQTTSYAKKKHLPTHEEIEKLVAEAFPTPYSLCPGLCTEFEDLANLLDDPVISANEKALILIKLHAVSAQIKRLHCRCTPQ